MKSRKETLIIYAHLKFRNPATNMQTRGGHLCFDLVTAQHNQTLGEKTELAHDCNTDKNS